MATSSYSPPTISVQEFSKHFHSRRLLLHTPLYITPPSSAVSPSTIESRASIFEESVEMVLSVLLCALIVSVGLNFIIRCVTCVLRCSKLVSVDETASTDKGIKKKALKAFPIVNYTSDLNLPGLDTKCAICLSDFAKGERVRVLPKCNHGFHVQCIDKWLNSHSSCPTCRRCLIETCQKILGCNQESGSTPVVFTPPQEIVICISPLQQEGFVQNHQI